MNHSTEPTPTPQSPEPDPIVVSVPTGPCYTLDTVSPNWVRMHRSHGDRRSDYFTPAEARQIADALNALADLQEGT